jgi:hypothetical protein
MADSNLPTPLALPPLVRTFNHVWCTGCLSDLCSQDNRFAHCSVCKEYIHEQCGNITQDDNFSRCLGCSAQLKRKAIEKPSLLADDNPPPIACVCCEKTRMHTISTSVGMMLGDEAGLWHPVCRLPTTNYFTDQDNEYPRMCEVCASVKGTLIPCSELSCSCYYHPFCALHPRTTERKAPGAIVITADDGGSIFLRVFCLVHVELLLTKWLSTKMNVLISHPAQETLIDGVNERAKRGGGPVVFRNKSGKPQGNCMTKFIWFTFILVMSFVHGHLGLARKLISDQAVEKEDDDDKRDDVSAEQSDDDGDEDEYDSNEDNFYNNDDIDQSPMGHILTDQLPEGKRNIYQASKSIGLGSGRLKQVEPLDPFCSTTQWWTRVLESGVSVDCARKYFLE